MFVFSNLAISLDGKIATASREHFPLGTSEDRKQMHVLRREADAILMGAETLRAFKKPLLVEQVAKQPLNIVMSSQLDQVSPTWAFFKTDKTSRLFFVGKKTPKARIQAISKTTDVVVLKDGTPFAKQIFQELKRRKVQRLLVEGGGSVMWEFASQGLIDEYHVTVTPRILGGREAPTLVDGPGFKANKSLKLKLTQCRVVGDELYLVYRKST